MSGPLITILTPGLGCVLKHARCAIRQNIHRDKVVAGLMDQLTSQVRAQMGAAPEELILEAITAAQADLLSQALVALLRN